MNSDEIKKQIALMKDYLRMNLDRDDFHACWDAAIDLQRLQDKMVLHQNDIPDVGKMGKESPLKCINCSSFTLLHQTCLFSDNKWRWLIQCNQCATQYNLIQND
jgi:hypothetical protein